MMMMMMENFMRNEIARVCVCVGRLLCVARPECLAARPEMRSANPRGVASLATAFGFSLQVCDVVHPMR